MYVVVYRYSPWIVSLLTLTTLKYLKNALLLCFVKTFTNIDFLAQYNKYVYFYFALLPRCFYQSILDIFTFILLFYPGVFTERSWVHMDVSKDVFQQCGMLFTSNVHSSRYVISLSYLVSCLQKKYLFEILVVRSNFLFPLSFRSLLESFVIWIISILRCMGFIFIYSRPLIILVLNLNYNYK